MNFREENEEDTAADKKSFTQALREKYCMSDGGGFDSISVISVSPKRKNATAELGHLRTIVLNNMNVMTADIPNQGLMRLCPNVVDLDLADNSMNKWSELLTILCHMPQLKFVNASKNSLNIDSDCHDLPNMPLNLENMALNYTGISIEDVIHICQLMPKLKELHLCGNDYEDLGSIHEKIETGALSSLECLRLNSNKIENWREIWKLRHLPCLKSLILSENPVSNFFYQDKEDKSDAISVEHGVNPQQDKMYNGDTEISSEVCPLLDTLNFQDFRNDVGSENKINDGCDRRMGYEEKSIKSLPQNDEYDLFLDEEARPVSRIGRHDDSDAEDEEDDYSDNEEFLLFGLPEDDRDDQFLKPYHLLDESKESNESFNTNSSNLTITDDDSLMEKATVSESSDTDMSKENNEKCQYALIAESFLYDILNSIDRASEADKPLCDFPQNFSVPNISEGVRSTPSLCGADLDIKREDQNNSGDTCKKDQTRIMCSKCGNTLVACDKPEKYTNNTSHNENLLENNSGTNLKTDTIICSKCHAPFTGVEISTHNHKSDSVNSSSNCQNVISSGKGSDCLGLNSPCQFQNESPGESTENSNLLSINPVHSENENMKKAQTDKNSELVSKTVPFENLDMLCLSNTGVSHWKDLYVFSLFPKLSTLRVQSNPLYSSVKLEDRRKLYIASLPNIKILNGSEVTSTEREKAENHYLRHFMHRQEKPDIYHTLVKKHDEPVELVDIDLSAGYQEWAKLDFVFEGRKRFTKKVHLTEQVGKLRNLISKTLLLPKRCFNMYFNPCSDVHPEYEKDMTELRCEALPMSRLDFADGDEIHIEIMTS